MTTEEKLRIGNAIIELLKGLKADTVKDILQSVLDTVDGKSTFN